MTILNAQQEEHASLKVAASIAATAPIASTNNNSTIISQMTTVSTQHTVNMAQMKQQNKVLRLQLLQQCQPVSNRNGN